VITTAATRPSEIHKDSRGIANWSDVGAVSAPGARCAERRFLRFWLIRRTRARVYPAPASALTPEYQGIEAPTSGDVRRLEGQRLFELPASIDSISLLTKHDGEIIV
jgi:hypothetical protein